MIDSNLLLSRRAMLAFMGAAIGSGRAPAFAQSVGGESTIIPPSSTLFYKPARTGHIWDTWIYHHKGTYYLYYNPSTKDNPRAKEGGFWNGVALATSDDGVHWNEHGFVIDPVPDLTVSNGVATPGYNYLGAGSVWRSGEKFIMNFSELRSLNMVRGELKQTIFFAESDDLIHWRRLGPEHAFNPDPRWYDTGGRWDNIWPVPRPGGGYYGYWAGWPKDGRVGIGFGESDDGIAWRASPPPALPDDAVEIREGEGREVSGAYFHGGKYYVLVGGDLLKEGSGLTRISSIVSDDAGGPFRVPEKNRHLLVGNASYFLRFVDVGGDVLANHHSWTLSKPIDWRSVHMAPLKKVEWDDEGTLRLKWWKGNEKAKAARIELKPNLIETAFNPDEALILEGKMSLSCSGAAGLYLQGAGDKGTGFLVRAGGLVEFGDINRDGSGFVKKGHVDRELKFGDKARFRLIRKGQLTEFYLNDYLMQCYSLPERGAGRIGIIGPDEEFRKLKAWYCG